MILDRFLFPDSITEIFKELNPEEIDFDYNKVKDPAIKRLSIDFNLKLFDDLKSKIKTDNITQQKLQKELFEENSSFSFLGNEKSDNKIQLIDSKTIILESTLLIKQPRSQKINNQIQSADQKKIMFESSFAIKQSKPEVQVKPIRLAVQHNGAFQILKPKNNNSKQILPSYYYNFEIRGLKKTLTSTCQVKEQYFSIFKEEKVMTQRIFEGPKTYKIIEEKKVNKPSTREVNYSPLTTKYVKDRQDLNKSEVLMSDSTNILNKVDSSISSITKSSVPDVQKSDKLIEMLTGRLEGSFEKFEKNEITSDQIFEIVKAELIPLRPLFISSKMLKEKVFNAISKGTLSQFNFLNRVFRNIVEESLKGIRNEPQQQHHEGFKTVALKTNDEQRSKIHDSRVSPLKSPIGASKKQYFVKENSTKIMKINNSNMKSMKKEKNDYSELPLIK